MDQEREEELKIIYKQGIGEPKTRRSRALLCSKNCSLAIQLSSGTGFHH